MVELQDAARRAGFDAGKPEESEAAVEVFGDVYDLSARLGLNTVGDLEKAFDQVDPGALKRIFEGQTIKSEWVISKSFLVLLLLISLARGSISADYLKERGWAHDIAEDVVRAVSIQ